jgi:hypothetical protein
MLGFFASRSNKPDAQETNMAKGQKRGNREIRKPKAKKPAPAVPVSALAIKGKPASAGSPKGKI